MVAQMIAYMTTQLVTRFKIIFLFFFLMLYFHSGNARDVEVTAGILQDGVYEDQPLKGVVSISHPISKSIDKESFLIENEKLKVDFVKDVRVRNGDADVLSLFNFTLPGKSKGAYVLPSISVNVGGKTYHSIMTSYTVVPRKEGDIETPAPKPVNLSKEAKATTPSQFAEPIKSILRLEAGIDGEKSVYPGQLLRVFYRYYFQGNVALTKEEIPLLEAKGFIKIGEKEIKDTSVEGVNVREISQIIQAVKSGTYSFGPSVIEGFAYENDSLGNPVYTSDKLTFEAPIVQITVMPFPEKSKPASFNGAVGKFTFETALNSSDTVQVNDTVYLSLIIQGKGNLNNLPIPDLCCQPGFSGFFKESDLAPKENIVGDVKTVTVPLRVLVSNIKEIPEIEFSYFSPETSNYVVLRSDPIPLHVKAPKPEKPVEQAEEQSEAALPASAAIPIEVETIMPLRSLDLSNLPFGSFLALLLVPFGIACIAFQFHLKNYIQWKHAQVLPVTSKDLFTKAFKNENACNFEALKNALTLALKENEIRKEDELYRQVEGFLADLDEERFGENRAMDLKVVKKQAEVLYKSLFKILNYKRK